jgi:hypothetical protein
VPTRRVRAIRGTETHRSIVAEPVAKAQPADRVVTSLLARPQLVAAAGACSEPAAAIHLFVINASGNR